MKRIIQVFLGSSHPWYHAVVLGVAIYAAYRIKHVEAKLDRWLEVID